MYIDFLTEDQKLKDPSFKDLAPFASFYLPHGNRWESSVNHILRTARDYRNVVVSKIAKGELSEQDHVLQILHELDIPPRLSLISFSLGDTLYDVNVISDMNGKTAEEVIPYLVYSLIVLGPRTSRLSWTNVKYEEEIDTYWSVYRCFSLSLEVGLRNLSSIIRIRNS